MTIKRGSFMSLVRNEQNFALDSRQINFASGARFSNTGFVIVPMPGPYSTMHSALLKSIFLIILLITYFELGDIAATSAGFLRKFEKNTKFEFILYRLLLYFRQLLFALLLS